MIVIIIAIIKNLHVLADRSVLDEKEEDEGREKKKERGERGEVEPKAAMS